MSIDDDDKEAKGDGLRLEQDSSNVCFFNVVTTN